LLERLGRVREAALEYEAASDRAGNTSAREFLERRLQALG
jgi:predicted RNA polymerase sigma factor